MSLLAAIAFLTVLPLPRGGALRERHLARSVRWFPLVGGLLGGLLALLDLALGTVLVEPTRDALLVVTLVVLSGALHLDGLMDTCDGYFAAVPRERRLEIMRDSHVGSFGVAGAGLILIGKYAALLSLGSTPRWAALIAMASLGRWAMSLAVTEFPSARPDGLGRLVKAATSRLDLVIAGLLTLLLSWLSLQLAGLLLWLVVSLVVILTARGLVVRLGGLTGDTYGALAELAELTALAMAPLCIRLVG
jgi:adenosylcobinamide-GDP ribazoletransferase